MNPARGRRARWATSSVPRKRNRELTSFHLAQPGDKSYDEMGIGSR